MKRIIWQYIISYLRWINAKSDADLSPNVTLHTNAMGSRRFSSQRRLRKVIFKVDDLDGITYPCNLLKLLWHVSIAVSTMAKTFRMITILYIYISQSIIWWIFNISKAPPYLLHSTTGFLIKKKNKLNFTFIHVNILKPNFLLICKKQKTRNKQNKTKPKEF